MPWPQDHQSKTAYVGTRVPADQKREVIEAARRQDVSVCQFLRHAIAAAVAQDTGAPDARAA